MWIAIQNAVGARQGVGGGPGPDPFTGFLDTPYGSGAVTAFSVRRLSSSTNEVLRVIRDTNGGVGHHDLIDVTFDASNNISLDSPVSNPSSSSAATNLGQFFGNPAYGNPDSLPATTITGAVHTWYDQAGTNHAVQTDYVRQPRIYSGSLSSGSLVLTGARLRLALANAYTNLELSAALTDSDLDIFTVSNVISGPTGLCAFLSSDPNDVLLISQNGDSSNHTVRMGTPSFYLQGNSFTGTTRGELYTALGGDGQTIIDAFNVDVSDAIYTRLGWPDVGVPAWEMQEVIFYNTDKTGSRQQIEENFNEYYQVTNLPYYTSGFLADYSGAAAAYSVRKLSNTAIKALRVRRTIPPYDELDIGFTPAGDLDEAAIVAFGAGNPLVVSRWYDQSGKSNHAVQETPGLQPQIYNGTAVLTDNGRPTLFASGDVFDITTISGLTEYTISYVARGGVGKMPAGNKNSASRTYLPWYQNASTAFFRHSVVDRVFSLTDPISTNQRLAFMYWDSNTVSHAVNGNTPDVSSAGFTAQPTIDRILDGYGGTTYAWDNNFQEIVIWNTDKNAAGQRPDIETNINDYYYVYNTSGFVVDYPGAIAAYSVRQLGNRQRYAMRVRRLGGAADYLDVGFVAGELDTQAIIDFGGSDTLGVEVWYDQSRSGNDATNTSTTTMPLIYDGTSIITDDNGVPALGRNSTGQTFSLGNIVPVGTPTCSFISVIKGDSNTNYGWRGSAGLSLHSLDSTNNISVYNGSFPVSSSLPSTTDPVLAVQVTGGASNEKGWRNGVFGYNALSGTGDARTNNLGLSTSTGSPVLMQEMILYPTDIDAGGTRINIETNINTYYGLYTMYNPIAPTSGFLFDYSGAEAAYSVRQLNNNATVAMRVRRTIPPYDELDIGFTPSGDLDTTAIDDFATLYGGNDLLVVSSWYDQSGNQIHVTQAAASQPIIREGTPISSIYYINGKAAIKAAERTGFNNTTFSNVSQPFTLTTVTSNNADSYLLGNNNQLRYRNTTDSKWLGTDVDGGGTIPTNDQIISFGVGNGSSSFGQLYAQSAQPSGVTFTNSSNLDMSLMGARWPSNSTGNKAWLQEFILWNTDQKTDGNQSGIVADTNSYFSTY